MQDAESNSLRNIGWATSRYVRSSAYIVACLQVEVESPVKTE